MLVFSCGYDETPLPEASLLDWRAKLAENWTGKRRLLCMHFIQAFISLATCKRSFDWKEIGASYDRRIGGSKKFDLYKHDFLTLVEEWAARPLPVLGLHSLGQITPICFAGEIIGRNLYDQ